MAHQLNDDLASVNVVYISKMVPAGSDALLDTGKPITGNDHIVVTSELKKSTLQKNWLFGRFIWKAIKVSLLKCQIISDPSTKGKGAYLFQIESPNLCSSIA